MRARPITHVRAVISEAIRSAGLRAAVAAAIVGPLLLATGGQTEAQTVESTAPTGQVATVDPGDPNWPGQFSDYQKEQFRQARDRFERLKHLLIPDDHFSSIQRRRLIRPGPLGQLFRPGVYDAYWPGWNRAVETYPNTRGFSPLEIVQVLERASRYGTLEVAFPEYGNRKNRAEIDSASRSGPKDRGSGVELKIIGGSKQRPTNPEKSLKSQISSGNSTFTRNPRIPLRFRQHSVVVIDAEHVPFSTPITVQFAVDKLRRKLNSLPKNDARHRRTSRFEISVGEQTAAGQPQLVVYDKKRGFYVVEGTQASGLHEVECPTSPVTGSNPTGQTSPSLATSGVSPSGIRYVSASSESPPAVERVAMAGCGEEEETNKQPTSPPAPALGGLAAPDLRGTLTEAQKLGGIDFSSLELRYLSVGSSDDPSTDYAFRARPTGGGANSGTVVDGIRNAMQASDSFFVWLSLPQSAFWVNLNPDEPDRIIDSAFGQTEAGRVLLESDLLLKKTDARLMDPNTDLGDAYWRQLRPAPDGSYCITYRVWIVPGAAKVRETGDSLYIVDAPLDVKMRPNEVKASDCASMPKATERHNASVYRRLLLPRVKQEVNTAPEFEPLRRVYLSRVAAEWYRQQSAAQSTAFGGLVDSGDIGRWKLQGTWRPKQTFRAFVKSFNQGEFTYTKRVVKGNVVEVHTYRTGGVDFTNIFKQNLSDAAFASLSPGLTETVAKGLQQVAVDPRTKARWLGGESPVDPTLEDTESVDPEAESTAYDGASDDPWGRDVAPYAVPLMVLLGAGLIGWAVLRERRRPSGPWGYR